MSNAEPQHDQEIRFAIVLYGGVSLAVYINGVVQELLRLVRSTALRGEVKPTEAVYRKLGQLLEPGVAPSTPPKPSDRIKTAFKVDIISGTSAGGINGIYLAKALASGSDLDKLEELWFNEGAIDGLLNDRKSYADLALKAQPVPQSLLNGRRMYIKLLEALDGMDSTGPSLDRHPATLAEEVDLFATTTDIEGVPVPIRLLDNIVYERRFRNAFHLRFIANERDDFQADNNPFLAFAARCTSSFPFAFEPMRLCEIDEILSTQGRYSDKPWCLSNSSRWQKFYTSYLQDVFGGATKFPLRSFGDGGYLNNAPFSYAVDALLTRQADLPVNRKLLYVEPSPAHPEEAPRLDKPNAVENSLAALVTIPEYQTIRNDLQRLLERNRAANRINETLGKIEADLQQTNGLPDRNQNLEEFSFEKEACFRGYYQMRASDLTDQLAKVLARPLRVDEESVLFVALRSLIRAWRELHYHIDPRPSGTDIPASTDGIKSFLVSFDLPYRIRRLRFVLRKLDNLYGLRLARGHPAYEEAVAAVVFGLGISTTEIARRTGLPPDLANIRRPLAKICANLQRLLRQVLEQQDPEDKHTPGLQKLPDQDPRMIVSMALSAENHDELRRYLEKIAGIIQDPNAEFLTTGSQQLLTTQHLDRPVNTSRLTDLACDNKARELLERDKSRVVINILTDFLNTLKDHLDGIFSSAFPQFNEPPFLYSDAGQIARRYYQCFDFFDCVQFPMMFGTKIGEPDSVDIIRICPEDAPALVPDVQDRRTKLKGLAVAHFGAFLDRDWRVNDLLWGRLDGAERIITALLPLQGSTALRDQLIDEAHKAIFEEFGARIRLAKMAVDPSRNEGASKQVTKTLMEKAIDGLAPPRCPADRSNHMELISLWRMFVPSEPKRIELMRTLARGTTIMGRMLDGIAGGSPLSVPAKWLTNAGRAMWGLVEISVPRHWATLLGRYWQSLLLLISIILILSGSITSAPTISGVGWILFGAAISLFILRTLLWDLMRAGIIRQLLFIAMAVILAALVVAGGFQTYRWVDGAWNIVGSQFSEWVFTVVDSLQSWARRVLRLGVAIPNVVPSTH